MSDDTNLSPIPPFNLFRKKLSDPIGVEKIPDFCRRLDFQTITDSKPCFQYANHWYKRIKEGATFHQVSVETGISKRRIQQMIHLAFLAPDIVRQITLGKQPMGLTSDWLLRHGMPAEWDSQRKRIANL